jgi:hypothetical protein
VVHVFSEIASSFRSTESYEIRVEKIMGGKSVIFFKILSINMPARNEETRDMSISKSLL